MNCSVCGTMVPDGSAVCPNCGANLIQYQQPNQGFNQQPVNSQPNGQLQQGGFAPQGMQGQPYGQPQQGGFAPQGMQGQPYGQPQQNGFAPQGMQGQPNGQLQQGGFAPQGMPPQGGFGQPAFGGGFGGAGKFGASHVGGGFTISKIMQLVGALLIFLAPLFNWLSVKIKGGGENFKEHANMFKLASDEYMDKGVFIFFGIMIMLIAIFLLFLEVVDFTPNMYSVKQSIVNIPFIELGVIALAFLFFLLVFFNGDLHDGIKLIKESMRWAKEYSNEVKGHVNHGFGPILAWIGVILAAVPRVFRAIGKDLDQMIG